eukprot:SAG31_NODE_10130_length_1179_cov_1.661972_3_plen_172_part_00
MDDSFYIFDDNRVEQYDLLNNLKADCFGGRTTTTVWDPSQRKHVRRDYDRHNSAYMLLYERVRKNQFFSEDKQVQEGHTCTMTDGAEGLRSTSSSRAASAEATASSTTASQSDQCVFAADSKLGSPELLFEVMAANLRFRESYRARIGSLFHMALHFKFAFLRRARPGPLA